MSGAFLKCTSLERRYLHESGYHRALRKHDMGIRVFAILLDGVDLLLDLATLIAAWRTLVGQTASVSEAQVGREQFPAAADSHAHA
eukprot:6206531-Pleurochrysis_carterae.AAC.1